MGEPLDQRDSLPTDIYQQIAAQMATDAVKADTITVKRADLERIISMLFVDDHEAADDDLYEAYMRGQYAGCQGCAAAFVLRALLEERELPPERHLAEYVHDGMQEMEAQLPRHTLLSMLSVLHPGNIVHSDACGNRFNQPCTCGVGGFREYIIKRMKWYGGVRLPNHVLDAIHGPD